jgi:hypothetical protein
MSDPTGTVSWQYDGVGRAVSGDATSGEHDEDDDLRLRWGRAKKSND